MIASDAERFLDNPFWSSLTTGHAHFALGGALARRYPADISPIAGLAAPEPPNIAALERIVEAGDDMATIARSTPILPAHWEILYESRVTQMIRSEPTPLPEDSVEASTLGRGDVPEMLALVELTKPGPFRLRTIELGTYIGLRQSGRLLAMAGERLWIDDFREVSAVCTHPEFQGRGIAKALVSAIGSEIVARGEVPFLQAYVSNAAAIATYMRLGFTPRRNLIFTTLQRRAG